MVSLFLESIQLTSTLACGRHRLLGTLRTWTSTPSTICTLVLPKHGRSYSSSGHHQCSDIAPLLYCTGMPFLPNTGRGSKDLLKVHNNIQMYVMVIHLIGLLGFFPDCYEDCQSFLRHKMTMISPSVLRQYSIPFNKVCMQLYTLVDCVNVLLVGRLFKKRGSSLSPFPMAIMLDSTLASTVPNQQILQAFVGLNMVGRRASAFAVRTTSGSTWISLPPNFR